MSNYTITLGSHPRESGDLMSEAAIDGDSRFRGNDGLLFWVIEKLPL